MVPIGVPPAQALLLKNQGTSEGFFKIDWQSKLGDPLNNDLKMQVIPERGPHPCGGRGGRGSGCLTAHEVRNRNSNRHQRVQAPDHPPSSGESMILELVIDQRRIDLKFIQWRRGRPRPMIRNQSIISAQILVDPTPFPESPRWETHREEPGARTTTTSARWWRRREGHPCRDTRRGQDEG